MCLARLQPSPLTRGLPACLFAYVYAFVALSGGTMADTPADKLTTTELEEKLASIDKELDELARYSLRTDYGAIGWRSQLHDSPDNTEWVRIQLGWESPIDELVLVPTLMRDATSSYRAQGFPLEFRVIFGNSEHPEGIEIASFGPGDKLLPRYAPVIIPCGGKMASWIQVEATVLGSRTWDNKHLFELSEIMAFSGVMNLALQKEVQTSSSMKDPSHQPTYLVDGFLPYLMDAAQGEQSVAYLASISPDITPEFIIDLGSTQTLNRIHLHAVEVSDSVPQPVASDLGIPGRLQVVGANKADFSDAKLMLNYLKLWKYDAGPIITRTFPETSCRYVKLTAYDLFINERPRGYSERTARIGFAEIELFAGERNVALGLPVKANLPENEDRQFTALTDGRNQFGDILPTDIWMKQLARRHALETERPHIEQTLKQRYLRQQTILKVLIWVAASLAAAIVIAILLIRIIHMHQIAGIRERLAADLHDELGADLYTIGLLGDAARNAAEHAAESPNRLRQVLERHQEVTNRAGSSLRRRIMIHETEGKLSSLKDDMERLAKRIMADVEYEIEVAGLAYLSKIKPITRDDLRLFFKECLVNISRHADASRITASLKATRSMLELTVCDNGRGLADAEDTGAKTIPASLRRRAHLLRAHVSSSMGPNGGTCITLRLRIPWNRRV